MRRSHAIMGLSVLFLGAFVYLYAVLDVGGQSLASHSLELWRSKVVQDKVTFVQARLQEKFDAQMNALNGERPHFKQPTREPLLPKEPLRLLSTIPAPKPPPKPHDVADPDRKSLDDMLAGHPEPRPPAP